MNRRHLFRFVTAASLAAAVSITLSATAVAQEKPLKVGVTAGPHAQIFEVVK